MRLITRDPFGRRDLMRTSHRAAPGWAVACAWCGQGCATYYQYAWVGDTQHSAYVRSSPPMCSIGCWRAYADE